MKRLLIILCSVLLLCCIYRIPNVSAYNVALGADVYLSGNPFFTEYSDWSTTNPDGSPASQALIDSIIDGVFLPEQTQWDLGTLWWDENSAGSKGYVTIDLGGLFSIESFIVQADNNDTYRLSYLDSGASEWTFIASLAGWGMMTRDELFLPDPVVTSMLMIDATAGDGWYSLSEIQAMGSPIPEPATILLLGVGLVGLAGTARKKLKK